jgi:MFS superfamily sulfate permease-like transporter
VTEASGHPLGRLQSPDLGTLRGDADAGVSGAIASVPDRMASAALVGINPVYGRATFASCFAPR